MRTRYEDNSQIRSRSEAIPPPVGGLNAKDALDNMPVTDAVELVNLFPDNTEIKLRKGFSTHANSGLNAAAVEGLFAYHGTDGTNKLIATASSGIFDVTTASTTASSLGSGYTNAKWTATLFNNKLIMCNGDDGVLTYNGSAISLPSIAGASSVEQNNFIHVNSYRSRPYFVEENTLSFWYNSTGADLIAGTYSEFDLQYVMHQGGSLLWTTDWTLDAGDGVTNYFVAMSDKGEAVVYSGPEPGDSSWTLNARVVLPKPIGRKSYLNVGSDLWILTEQGIVPMSQVLSGNRSAGAYEFVTDKIQKTFKELATSHRTKYGWQLTNFGAENYFIVNVPTATGSTYVQYVMNTLTGAWCKFEGLNAVSWAVLGDELYFGGTNGDVYQANNGENDNGANINFAGKLAFNYFNDRSTNKLFLMARPLISSNNATSLGFGFDVDFQDVGSVQDINVSSPSGAVWDTSLWDNPASVWSDGKAFSQDWASITGVGRAGSLKFAGGVKNVNFSISGFHVIFTPGGYL